MVCLLYVIIMSKIIVLYRTFENLSRNAGILLISTWVVHVTEILRCSSKLITVINLRRFQSPNKPAYLHLHIDYPSLSSVVRIFPCSH